MEQMDVISCACSRPFTQALVMAQDRALARWDQGQRALARPVALGQAQTGRTLCPLVVAMENPSLLVFLLS